MIQKLNESRRWQIFFIVGLILIVPLTVDINGRISIIRRMHHKEALFQQEISRAREEHQQLQAQLESLRDPAFVEEWARVEARMTMPGEVALIPVYLADEQPEAPLNEEDRSGGVALSVSEQWHRLFFDAPASP